MANKDKPKVRAQEKAHSHEKTKAPAPRKAQTTAKKQKAAVLIRAPAEYIFWCHDGCTFVDINELAAGLAAMSDETFAYHSNPAKQDFANWVRDILLDIELAEDLARATNRLEAARCVAARIASITE